MELGYIVAQVKPNLWQEARDFKYVMDIEKVAGQMYDYTIMSLP